MELTTPESSVVFQMFRWLISPMKDCLDLNPSKSAACEYLCPSTTLPPPLITWNWSNAFCYWGEDGDPKTIRPGFVKRRKAGRKIKEAFHFAHMKFKRSLVWFQWISGILFRGRREGHSSGYEPNPGLVVRDTSIRSLLAVVICHLSAFGQSDFTLHFNLSC